MVICISTELYRQARKALEFIHLANEAGFVGVVCLSVFVVVRRA